MTTSIELSGVLADHVAAVNAFDLDAIMATFAPDALVNDARREFRGTDAIRRWAAKEMVGDRVTIEVTEVAETLRAGHPARPATTGTSTSPRCRTS